MTPARKPPPAVYGVWCATHEKLLMTETQIVAHCSLCDLADPVTYVLVEAPKKAKKAKKKPAKAKKAKQ